MTKEHEAAGEGPRLGLLMGPLVGGMRRMLCASGTTGTPLTVVFCVIFVGVRRAKGHGPRKKGEKSAKRPSQSK